ncbi:bifunctional folylpolyglutamate synthase/dihydrofolate synthase [Synechocystis salina]|uniref:tetrahydrofolate synthase n=1 Tax=Synechocystis salina LEGE 00031 TaxID=1828736 RepID=A0ABR9VMP8_9SYNC|nr:folylpolyglutamate synthase/dihydrofolate synthase family protein [Synechocystis salina]MBE9240886.1 bifunctional folylpolyglutamate synthase/dihydrofolate synthase [Synechocystis salina LEGE 00041]MBE9252604.1 bifunctional folylpolyglutamate synthase/dihydrofolate synthase [Synechocystis salina LEGE 00031]
MDINTLLEPYKTAGVNLGLERIHGLLAKLGNPQAKVPYIHVGGTNGKGSVCAYLSSVLAEAGYKVGRYTSPHLIDWQERVWLNNHFIDNHDLMAVLQQVTAIAKADSADRPTLFEVFTAAVWLYFAQAEVDIAVMEVGLGGRLDATNVPEPCLLSIITSLSREHWQVLGPTVVHIAREKVGILKAARPVFLGHIPAEAQPVFRERIAELHCPDYWIDPAVATEKNGQLWANWQGFEYPLALLGNFQLQNSALAIAALQELQQQGWDKLTPEIIQRGMAKATWPGRLQWVDYNGQKILLDGAHNPAAAKALANYTHHLVDHSDHYLPTITWVMGMLSTKEHDQIFRHLLRPGDRLLLVPVPDHDSGDLPGLERLAWQTMPELSKVKVFDDCFTALENLEKTEEHSKKLTVLCGSLYLVGYFLKKLQSSQ